VIAKQALETYRRAIANVLRIAAQSLTHAKRNIEVSENTKDTYAETETTKVNQ